METRISKKSLLLGLVVAVSLVLASLANAQPGEFVKGVLQPLADGFPNRTITIIVVDDPGSNDDLYAKSLQAALKDISPVPVLTSNEPAAVGGTWYTLQETLKREGGVEGYYPIVYDSFGGVTDLFIEPGTRKIGANLDQLNMIIGTDTLPYVMVQRKDAPWGPTFAGLVKYAKANPGKVRYISKEVGTGLDITCEWIMDTVGMKVKKIPQGSFQEVASTIGAGMGDFSLIVLPVAVTNYEAGRLDILMLTGDTVPEMWKKDPNILSAKQAGLDPSFGGSIKGLGTSSKVPQAHVDWLFKLFKAAALSDIHQKRLKTFPGMIIKVVDGATKNAQHREIYKKAEPVIRALGMHIDQLKK